MACYIKGGLISGEKVTLPRCINNNYMMSQYRWLVLLLGSVLACQAWATENWVGEYSGKLSEVAGFGGDVGDPCDVVVGTSDVYGGSLVFEIRNTEKILMETRNVEQALKRKSNTVKLITPGSSSSKLAEIVVITLGDGGTMKSLKLMRKWGQQLQEKSVTCGDLIKK